MNQEHLRILAEVKKWELSHLDLVQSVQCVTPLEALAAMQRLQEQKETIINGLMQVIESQKETALSMIKQITALTDENEILRDLVPDSKICQCDDPTIGHDPGWCKRCNKTRI